MFASIADVTVPRFLIVRMSAIGDVIHGLPVLTSLRAAWPQAFIAWVVEGRAAELLAGHAALDIVVSIKRGWLKHPASVLDLRRRLRTLDVDIAIDLQGLTKSAVAARLSGARQRIGFAGPDGREISPWLNNSRVLPTATHVIDRNLELLRRWASMRVRLAHAIRRNCLTCRNQPSRRRRPLTYSMRDSCCPTLRW